MNSSVKELIIDSSNADSRNSRKFRGFGITADSRFSKLMADYKFSAPDAYKEIMKLMFRPGYGAGISHIKIEQRFDAMPEFSDKAEYSGIYEDKISFSFAADAKKINPDITVELKLSGKCSNVDNIDKKYRSIRKFLDSMYGKFNVAVDFISIEADNSEYKRQLEFLSRLKKDNNSEYDYSRIKAVLCDDTNYSGAAMLADNEELRKNVDIIEIKSPVSDENLMLLSEKFSKEIWYSESALNSSGTLSEYLTAVCRSHIPVTLCCMDPQKLIKASEPWSGFYEINIGLWKILHISWFVKKGCKLALSGSSDDAEKYAAFVSDGGTYALIAENDSGEVKKYNVCIRNVTDADSNAYCIETRRAEKSENFCSHWFKVADKIIPARNKSGWFYRLDVKPYSIVTCITSGIEKVDGTDSVKQCSYKHAPLLLPYTESFSYEENQLEECCGNPFYTDTIRGSFKICRYENENVLKQIIQTEGFSGESAAILIGDSCWNNYSFKAEILFDNTKSENYAGIGVRCIKGIRSGECGYQFRVYPDGRWQLWNSEKIEMEGRDENLSPEKWNVLRMSANHNRIRCFLNKQLICEYIAAVPMMPAGCAAIYSAYYANRFKDLSVTPVIGAPEYSIKRNVSEDTCSEYKFIGEAVALIGDAEGLRLKIEIDGRIMTAGLYIEKCSNNQAFYYKSGLSAGEHTIKISVLSGKLQLKEIITDDAANTILKSIGAESKPGKRKKKGKIRKSTLLIGAGLAVAGAGTVIFKKLRKKRK